MVKSIVTVAKFLCTNKKIEHNFPFIARSKRCWVEWGYKGGIWAIRWFSGLYQQNMGKMKFFGWYEYIFPSLILCNLYPENASQNFPGGMVE